MAVMNRFVLSGNADCTEFCPVPGYHSFLAAGTYTLKDGPEPERIGSLHLFHVSRETFLQPLRECHMHEVCRVTPPGIFDIKWRADTTGSKPLLGRATADGSLAIYTLDRETETGFRDDFDQNQLLHCNDVGSTARLATESDSSESNMRFPGAPYNSGVACLNESASVICGPAMCLSLDWDTFSSSASCQLVLSQSDGSLCVARLTGSALIVERRWEAHGYEAWTAAFDRWHTQAVYSGGDDCVFQGWDLRGNCSHPTFMNLKSHSMGVCCIQSHPLTEHLVATGSYDENVRLWDARNLSRPVEICQVAVGGGVWRLKWHPSQPNLLLAACMHNGFAVLNVGLQPSTGSTQDTVVQENQGGMSILEQYTAHDSLGYGADWCHENPEWEVVEEIDSSMFDSSHCGIDQGEARIRTLEESICGLRLSRLEATSKAYEDGFSLIQRNRGRRWIVATCSFYDSALHLWRTKVV